MYNYIIKSCKTKVPHGNYLLKNQLWRILKSSIFNKIERTVKEEQTNMPALL
jgi:hypothetical protein